MTNPEHKNIGATSNTDKIDRRLHNIKLKWVFVLAYFKWILAVKLFFKVLKVLDK